MEQLWLVLEKKLLILLSISDFSRNWEFERGFIIANFISLVALLSYQRLLERWMGILFLSYEVFLILIKFTRI